MPRIKLIGLILALGVPSVASAQIGFVPGAGTPVREVGENLILNGIQSAEAVFQSAEWVLDLLPLEEFVFPDAAAEDLAQLQALAEQAAALGVGWDNNRALLGELFDPEGAPRTTYEFRQRVTQINQTLFETYGYATDTQNLLLTAIRTVQQIIRLIESVSVLEGKLSVQQTLSQQLGKLQQLQTEGNLQRSAFERAKSLEGVTPGVLDQGVQNIVDAMMDDHPRW
jgi:hypothetical protein